MEASTRFVETTDKIIKRIRMAVNTKNA